MFTKCRTSIPADEKNTKKKNGEVASTSMEKLAKARFPPDRYLTRLRLTLRLEHSISKKG